MGFELTARDKTRLKGVHPDLVKVVKRAAEMSKAPFAVIEGLRTVERQRQLVRQGASKTMNSRHIKAKNGYGHAVDLYPIIDGQPSAASWRPFFPLAKLIKAAALDENVSIEWGGDWKGFPDGPHWQLPWGTYKGGGANAEVAHEDDPGERTVQTANAQEGAMTAGVGLMSGGAIGGEVLTNIASTVSDQQEGLSSGQWVRIGIATFIIAAAAFFAWRQYRASN